MFSITEKREALFKENKAWESLMIIFVTQKLDFVF